jgi:hypothetical protein
MNYFIAGHDVRTDIDDSKPLDEEAGYCNSKGNDCL